MIESGDEFLAEGGADGWVGAVEEGEVELGGGGHGEVVVWEGNMNWEDLSFWGIRTNRRIGWMVRMRKISRRSYDAHLLGLLLRF